MYARTHTHTHTPGRNTVLTRILANFQPSHRKRNVKINLDRRLAVTKKGQYDVAIG